MTDTEIPPHKKYVITQEWSKGEHKLKPIRKVIDEDRDEFREGLKEATSAPSKEQSSCYVDLQKAMKAWYESIDLNEVQLNSIDFFLTNSDKYLSDKSGVAPDNTVIVRKNQDISYILNMLGEIDEKTGQEVADYIIMMSASHELYHATSPGKYTLVERKGQNGKTTQPCIERYGLRYYSIYGQVNKDNHSGAYEEGLAVLSESRQKDVIDKHFPLASRFFKQLNDRYKDKMPVGKLTDGDLSFYPTRYPESTKMVVTLHTIMRSAGFNIEKLEEEARVNHKTLQLARSIDGVFGQGTYLEIVRANEETASKITDLLESRLTSRTVFK